MTISNKKGLKFCLTLRGSTCTFVVNVEKDTIKEKKETSKENARKNQCFKHFVKETIV